MEMKFEHSSFGKRLKSMLSVDFRRMFTMPLFYIMVGAALAIPILILVMTTMMDGSVSVDPTTGEETVMEGFDNAWQAIASVSSTETSMSMDLTSMCNINMMYFLVAVLVCLFVTEDFKSGYAKNLFTVRAKKTDYVFSKSLIGFVGGVCMVVAYLVGTIIGGSIAGLPFDTGIAGISGVVMCMLSKALLMSVFVPLYVLACTIAKSKTWLSLVLSLGTGMLLYTMAPMISPLDSGIMNVVMCLAGGAMFNVGIGAISNTILKKKSIL